MSDTIIPTDSFISREGDDLVTPVREELNRLREILHSMSNGVTVADLSLPDCPLIYVNPAFERMTGYSADECLGHNCRFLQREDRDQPGVIKVHSAIREHRNEQVLLKNYRKDGTSFWNELYLSPILDLHGKVTHFVGFQNDVTARIEAALQMEYMATHDSLTGLANRGLMMEHLRKALPRAKRLDISVAVLFFDLNRFKEVNDQFGHEAGDSLLRFVAERLTDGARGSDTVARLGGDEFIVVLQDIQDERVATDIMQRLVRRVEEGFEIAGQRFHTSTSVGMALYPRDADTAESLLRFADQHMYSAKKTSSSVPATTPKGI